MPRYFRSSGQIPATTPYYLIATFWISVLLSICHIPSANAMFTAHIGAAMSAVNAKALLHYTQVRYCDERYYDCNGRKTVVRHDTAPAETYHASHHSKPDHYEKPVEVECQETYETVEVLPLPDEYDPYWRNRCGVRCWYKRLTSGYCGRGCDYYLYRLGKSHNPCKPRY